MTRTGQESPTDRRDASGLRRRPGWSPGRLRRPARWLGRVASGLLAAFALCLAVPCPVQAQFQELFTWWRRQLLPLSLEPGAWVRLERREAAAGEVLGDTLTCAVLQEEPDGSHWVEVRASRSEEAWLLHVDLHALTPGTTDLFEALRDLIHVDPDGTLVRESLDDLEESRMIRRHLEDLFENPSIERHDLPDSVVAGRSLAREEVILTETREARAPMGTRTLVHRSDLRSQAVLSAGVPVFGLLSATTWITVTSRWEPDDEKPMRRRPPPLLSEIRIRCLDFGWEHPRGLPSPLPPDVPD
jgi:hypothetical protein